MFPYGIINVAGLKMKQSVIPKDSIESKTYTQAGTGPTNQPEFYVYVNGEIELTNGDFTQTMTERQSSFDVNLQSYDITKPVVEKVLTNAATRFGISSEQPWEKTVVTLDVNETHVFTKESLMLLMSGMVETSNFAAQGFFFRTIDAGTTVTALSDNTKLIICNLV